jgi:hypothetical protein
MKMTIDSLTRSTKDQHEARLTWINTLSVLLMLSDMEALILAIFPKYGRLTLKPLNQPLESLLSRANAQTIPSFQETMAPMIGCYGTKEYTSTSLWILSLTQRKLENRPEDTAAVSYS